MYKYTIINNVVKLESNEILLKDNKTALDLIFTVTYENNCNYIIIDKKNISEEFFELRTGFAGEILQKLINYSCKLAIVGDFSDYSSNALKDFIYECNKGNDFFFVESEKQAIKILEKY